MDNLGAFAAGHIGKAAPRAELRPATRSRSKWYRGHTMVEFGLSATAFLMLTFGIMDCGRALYAYHFVDYAARAATRYAIVRGSSSTTPAKASDIQTYVTSLATGLNANASCSGSPPTTPNGFASPPPGHRITLQAATCRLKCSTTSSPLAPFF
jgi:Flp pilus assembly protein TadG